VSCDAAQTEPVRDEHQTGVDRHFDQSSELWRTLYAEPTVWGASFRERQSRAVEWAVRAAPEGGRALDVGCGAGGLAVELARRGFAVEAIDSSQAMLANARAAAEQAGVTSTMAVSHGDVHQLDHPDQSFDVVVALGVLPWVRHPDQAAREMRRVLKPGGHLIFSCDNALALQLLLDPRLLPLLDPAKRIIRARAGRRWHAERPRTVRGRTVERLLAAAALELTQHSTLQFGPFSFLGLPLTSERAALRLHVFLQRQADSQRPLLRGAGRQHMVLARRPTASPTLEGDR
jgi:2-polyprenyl-3-methyl-5-hydroxy-6-metoxy-1,4-benzoquinol methylase